VTENRNYSTAYSEKVPPHIGGLDSRRETDRHHCHKGIYIYVARAPINVRLHISAREVCKICKGRKYVLWW
jgi:hypothetical protein